MQKILSASLLALSTLAATAGAQTVTDDFNRPDSTNMGPNWLEENGDWEIKNNQAFGLGLPWDDLNIMSTTAVVGTYTETIASIDVGTNGKFGAACGIVIGYAGWQGLSAKIQDNDGDAMFDRVFFEPAINAGSWYSQGTPIIFDLTNPIATGRLELSTLDADTAIVNVYDLAGNLLDSGTAAGITLGAFPPVGNQVGVYTKNAQCIVDNFFAGPKSTLVGMPATLSVAAGGVQSLNISLGAAHAGELFLLLGSTSGTGPGTPAGDGVTLPLNVDSYFLHTLSNPGAAPLTGSSGALDANGAATATFTLPPAFDPALVGVGVDHAAVSFSISGGLLTVTAATDPAHLTLVP